MYHVHSQPTVVAFTMFVIVNSWNHKTKITVAETVKTGDPERMTMAPHYIYLVGIATEIRHGSKKKWYWWRLFQQLINEHPSVLTPTHLKTNPYCNGLHKVLTCKQLAKRSENTLGKTVQTCSEYGLAEGCWNGRDDLHNNCKRGFHILKEPMNISVWHMWYMRRVYVQQGKKSLATIFWHTNFCLG